MNPQGATRQKYPTAPLAALDTLWFQVAGTICNLECTHCFISCSPTNRNHEMLPLAVVKRYLEEAKAMGVREYYFTGGEPFLNRDMPAILEETLKQGPAAVLTNGVLLNPSLCARLKALSDGSSYSLDIRISLDGYDEKTNDPIRGKGSFKRILKGVAQLAEAGLSPVITVTEACEDAATTEGRLHFLNFLREIGLEKPRLKILPLLRMGAEATRGRAYEKWESLLDRDLGPDEASLLQCSSCRMVTSKGVYVCPLLIDSSDAKMGETLGETLGPFRLSHQACFTCYEMGLNCRT